MSAPHRPYRILSMDGGPGSPTYTRQLLDIEYYVQTKYKRSFLNSIDMFAGTSDGGWMSLYLSTPQNVIDAKRWLATKPSCDGKCGPGPDFTPPHLYEESSTCRNCIWHPDDPELALAQARLTLAIEFSGKAGASLAIGFGGILRLASGLFSALPAGRFEKLLGQWYNGDGSDVNLGQLTNDVALVTLCMGGEEKFGARTYTNLARHATDPGDDPTLSMSAIEAAMRTSAFPVFLPMRSGHIDGSAYANNPAMCAIAELLAESRDDRREGLEERCLDDIVMLSMGVSDRQLGTAFDSLLYRLRSAPIGWIPWLLEPFSPLLLMDAMIVGADSGVAFQCKQLLRDRFLRVATAVPTGMIGEFLDVMFGFKRAADSKATDAAIAWEHGSTEGEGASWPDTREFLDNVWMPTVIKPAPAHQPPVVAASEPASETQPAPAKAAPPRKAAPKRKPAPERKAAPKRKTAAKRKTTASRKASTSKTAAGKTAATKTATTTKRSPGKSTTRKATGRKASTRATKGTKEAPEAG